MITMWHNIQNEINSPQGHSSGVLIIFIEDGHIMSSLKDNKTCALLQQYLSYLTIVKGRSRLTYSNTQSVPILARLCCGKFLICVIDENIQLLA